MALTKVKAGNILLTTPGASSNDVTPATTQYVTTAIGNLIDTAPSTLNTLNELAAALGDDVNFSTTVTNSIATKLPLAGGTMTGLLTVGAKLKLTDLGNATVAALQLTDSGLGISSPSTDQMNFITADTTRMVIDSSGRVGVGVSPAAWNTTTGGRTPIQVGFGSISGRLNDLHTEFTNNAYVSGTGNDPQWAGITRWAKSQIEHDSAGQIVFKTSPVVSESAHNSNPNITWNERIVIQNSGNVGIGTTAPSTYFSGGNDLVVKQASGEGGITVATGDDTTGYLLFADGTSGDAQYRGQIAYKHGTGEQMIVGSTGDLSLRTGSSRTEHMRINSSGIMTVARTPGFVAIMGSSQSFGSGVRGLSGNFWTTIHHNMGGHFSTTTGKFTAPVTGLYWFNVSLATDSNGAATTYLGAEMYHNTQRIYSGWNEHTAGYQKTNASYQVYMTAGDTAHAGVETQVSITLLGSSNDYSRYNVFSGYLIG